MRFIRKLNAFNERRRVKGTAEAYDRFWTAGFYRLCQEPRLTAVMVHSGRFFLKCFMLASIILFTPFSMRPLYTGIFNLSTVFKIFLSVF